MLVIDGKKSRSYKKDCISIEGDPIFTLIDYWFSAFKKKYKIDYAYGTASSRYDNVGDLYVSMGRDLVKTKKIIDIFLNHHELEWVNNKTLPWLCKPSNLTFVVPHLNRTIATKRRPNWTNSRGQVYRVTAI